MKTLKPIITAFIIGLLLSFVGLAQASIDVKLKTASGVEKLGVAGYQQKTVFNLLFHQGKIGFSYDDVSGSPVAPKSAPNITKAYKRPSGATTKAQRESVQGKPCVDCGATTPKQFADHKDPLVKEYYRTGNIDKTRMRDLESVQPQCPTCSSRQGAEMSRFSRQQKKDLGL